MNMESFKEKITKVENEPEELKIQLEEQTKIEYRYPEVFQLFYDDFLSSIIKQDERLKVILKRDYKKQGDDKFKKSHTQFEYELLNKSRKQIEDDNAIKAQQTMINLNERITAVVGANMDVTEVSYNNGELTGIISGDKGKATLITSIAGGFNKQKLHIRFRIKSIDAE